MIQMTFMAGNIKSVKLFNLEDRKLQNGSITEVDIFQWKNTLQTLQIIVCTETYGLDVEKVANRGFVEPDPASRWFY